MCTMKTVCRGKKKQCVVTLLLLCCTTWLYLTSWASHTGGTPMASQPRLNPSTGTLLPLFLRDVAPSAKEHNIYQIITSDPERLLLRHYCSVESYCRYNPQSRVWILLLSPGSSKSWIQRMLRLIGRRCPNLMLARLDLDLVVQDTPLQDIVASGKLGESSYPQHHLSDILRLAVVAKAGGLYTDFDFICLRSVAELRNTMALEIPAVLMNGLFHFDAGHPLLQLIMKDDRRNFNGKWWAYNGPLLFTRVTAQHCPQFTFLTNGGFANIGAQLFNTAYRRTMSKLSVIRDLLTGSSNVSTWSVLQSLYSKEDDVCQNVTVLQPSAFMAVNFNTVLSFFENGTASIFDQKIRHSSYAVHLFNKVTRNLTITPGSGSGVEGLLAAHCPVTYTHSVQGNWTL